MIWSGGNHEGVLRYEKSLNSRWSPVILRWEVGAWRLSAVATFVLGWLGFPFIEMDQFRRRVLVIGRGETQ